MPHCEQQNRLKDAYLTAVNAYGEILSKAKDSKASYEFNAGQVTQERSRACQKALKAFFDHVQEHGCSETDA